MRRVPGRSKYGAVRTEVDGITFASKKEARRYGELRLLERAGEISGLELQPRFPLYVTVCGERIDGDKLGEYRGDFRYLENGREVVEDVKGVRTPLYRWKKKHAEAQYGITITEI